MKKIIISGIVALILFWIAGQTDNPILGLLTGYCYFFYLVYTAIDELHKD